MWVLAGPTLSANSVEAWKSNHALAAAERARFSLSPTPIGQIRRPDCLGCDP
jgi:hypothetical protein